MEASFSLRAGPVRFDANGAVLKARFDDFKATVGPSVVSLAGRVPLNIPQQSANFLAFWDVHRNWQVRTVLRYVGKRFSDNTNSAAARIPSYKVWDLGGTSRAMERLSLDFRFDNVTDEIYADSGSTSQWILGQPRSVSVAARVSF
jgi:iron complex outermembrane recepter protein